MLLPIVFDIVSPIRCHWLMISGDVVTTDCKKLAPSKLEIGTYTSNTVRLVGSCVFSLVHPDTKCLHLQEVTFYVASNNGSVLVSCVTWPHLHLAWYSLTLDWTIFHQEPALLPVVLSTQRRQSPTSVHIFPEKNLQCLLAKLVTSKTEMLIEMFL